MYRWYMRRFCSLNKHLHVAVLLSTLVIPVFLQVFQGWRDTGFCPRCVIWSELALYVVFYQIAMLLLASATRQDRARVEEGLERTSSALTDRIEKFIVFD